MYEKNLESLGLTPNEAKIYRALLELKTASIWNISSSAGIHRRNTYDAIQRLIDRGLAFQVLPKKVLTYAPVHPDKLKELIEEKERELTSILPGLVKKFDKVSAPQEVCIYKGVGGLKNYIDLILKEKNDIYGIGSKGTWFDKRISAFAKKAEKKYKDLKIKSVLIFDEDLKKHTEVFQTIGGPHKFLPKKYCGESSIDIFGDYVAIYSGVNMLGLDSDITIFILKDKSLAQDIMRWWQFMWDMLPNN
ncbi:MAG: helix-turn-helix domain-containing protein [bacterium]